MSVSLGIIMSKDTDFKILENLKERYDLGLFKIENEDFKHQLLEDEMFLQATKTGYDSKTGIGIYKIYVQDGRSFYKLDAEKRILDFCYNDFQKDKKHYKDDVIKWMRVIKLLKRDYNVKKLCMFWHSYRNLMAEDKIPILTRVHCNVQDISIEYMMKIKYDELVFFEK